SVRQNQAYVALHQNNAVQATAFLTESLALSRDANDEVLSAFGLAARGGVAARQRRPGRAARLLGAAEALFDTFSFVVDPPQLAEHGRYAAAARALLGEEAIAA